MKKSRDSGLALANFTLISHMLQMLRNLELIDEEEAREVVEQALLDLETNQGVAKPEDRDTFRTARWFLDRLRKDLGRPPAKRQLRARKARKRK